MRKIILTALMIAGCVSLCFAQGTPRAEFSAGFQIDSINLGSNNNLNGVPASVGGTGTMFTGFGNDNRQTGYGFVTSGTGYLNRFFGIEGNFDGDYKRKDVTFATFNSGTGTITSFATSARLSSYNVMGGPHFRIPGANNRFGGFAHVLLGVNHTRINANGLNGIALTGGTGNNTFNGGSSLSDTDFAMKFGGGVDIYGTSRVGLRIGADYNPIFQRGSDNLNFSNLFLSNTSNRTRNDFLFNIGVVFK